MRLVPIALLLSMTGAAVAADAESTVFCSHSDEARADVRVLGHVNVNTATREQLALVPALDPSQIDAILEARARGPVTALSAFDLSDEALVRLTTTGPSTLHRIRALPLEVFAPARRTAQLSH